MIPTLIDSYLREHGVRFQHRPHRRVVAAQRLAASEHVPGARVAKVIVVSVDGQPEIAVVAANERLDVDALRAALGAREVHLLPERSYVEKFWPCEAGAEPPLAMFGLPIYVDARLASEPWLVMRGGTHEDAIRVDTDEWISSEQVRIIGGLGVAVQ